MLDPVTLALLRQMNRPEPIGQPGWIEFEVRDSTAIDSAGGSVLQVDTPKPHPGFSAILDIETLSREDNAVVTEIGAVAFRRDDFSMADFHSGRPDIFDQLAKYRHVCPETIAFHRKHGTLPELRGEEEARDSIPKLRQWLALWKPKRIWIQGKDFDLRILRNFAADFDATLPWDYWQPACARDHWESAFPGVKHAPRPHRAVDDCIATLRDLKDSLEKLGCLESA